MRPQSSDTAAEYRGRQLRRKSVGVLFPGPPNRLLLALAIAALAVLVAASPALASTIIG